MTVREKAELIVKDIKKEQGTNPVVIFKQIAEKEYISIHGPEHHILDGASLLVAYKNAGGEIDLEQALDRLMSEGLRMPGAMCGLWGICGAITSIGAALAIIDGTGPLSTDDLIAEPEDKGTRIDKYLSQELEDVSRSRIQKLLDDGDITVDDKCVKSNYKLNGTEHITITIPELIVPQILPENIPLNIIYEDDDVILIDKPKGMVVHPAAGHYTGTVVNALMYHCRDNLSGINGVMRPGIVHRIDMNTTGVIVACKNDKAHNDIAAQLAVHSITRKYYCIVHNRFKEEEGTVDAPIGRNPKDRKMMAIDRKNGKRAVTHYRVLENFDKYSFIECQLETGRTHQIRVHMASIGHPILGDDVYSHARSGYKLQGQTLHAGVLGFIHPSTGEYMEFKAPLPEYFEKLLKDLRNGGSN